MLQTNRQNDYSEFDFEFFKNNYNNNLINLANIQLNLLNTMPSNIDFISKLADKLSNLIVIKLTCYKNSQSPSIEPTYVKTSQINRSCCHHP